MLDIRPLIQPSFWLDLDPPALTAGFERFFFVFFAAMIILGAIVRIVARQKKQDRYIRSIFSRVANLFFIMGTLGMTIYFFSFEGIYMFGARFWFLVWFIGLVTWIVFIVRYAKVTIPLLKGEAANRAEFNKYIPRKKK